MTLQTGKAARSAELRAGFTLIELMLVMALLTVVTALAAPQLSRFFKGRGLDAEARRFVALTRYGQNRAVGEGVPMVLWIDGRERVYGLQRQPGFSRNEDERAVEFELGKDLEMEAEVSRVNAFSATASRSSRENVRPVFGNLPAMVFTPDGFISPSSPESVVLREGEADQIRVGLSRNGLNYEIQTNQQQRVRVRR